MDKYFRRLVDWVEVWTVLLLVLMVLLVSLGVFFRYVLNASLSWYDEFASFLLVWLTFYGAVVASLLMQKMGDETTVSLVWVKMSWIYSVMPITGGLMLVISLMRFVSIATGNESGKGGDSAWSGSSSQ